MRVSRGMEPKDVPGKLLAFCAIGRPESFFAQLREARIDLAATKSFRDHHAYKPPDIGVLQQLVSVRRWSRTSEDCVERM